MQLDELTSLIAGRRTHMLVDRQRPVPRELVAQLCELAQWAPNHKRTWPWRFALATGDGRARLGDAIADHMDRAGAPSERVAKARGKYLRTPATLIVGSIVGDSPLRTAENRDAVAAGIQNFMLGASAAGLATYWGSCPDDCHGVVSQLCGFESDTFIATLMYLGYAEGSVEAPVRPPITLIDIN
jgi:nitroreductase